MFHEITSSTSHNILRVALWGGQRKVKGESGRTDGRKVYEPLLRLLLLITIVAYIYIYTLLLLEPVLRSSFFYSYLKITKEGSSSRNISDRLIFLEPSVTQFPQFRSFFPFAFVSHVSSKNYRFSG